MKSYYLERADERSDNLGPNIAADAATLLKAGPPTVWEKLVLHVREPNGDILRFAVSLDNALKVPALLRVLDELENNYRNGGTGAETLHVSVDA